MRLLVHGVLAVLMAVMAPAIAAAQSAPAGWTVTANAQGWTARSPDVGQGRTIRIVYAPVTRTTAPIDAWARNESHRRAASWGRVVGEYDPERLDQRPYPLLIAKTWAIIEPGATVETQVVGWVYDTAQGRQAIYTLSPFQNPSTNATHNAALAAVNEAWKAGAVFNPAAPPPKPQAGAVAAAPAQQSAPTASAGRNCRREPIWGFRVSPFCQPSGICNDRVIKGYETVCDP